MSPAAGAQPWWRSPGFAVLVLCVVVLGAGLRSAHYRAGYGHPDETITTEVVGHMRASGDWDTNWAKAPNLDPSLRYDQYNFSSHLFATFGFYRFVKVLPGTGGWRSENGGFWVYRFFSVLLGSVVVWQAIRLGERLGGRTVAWLAGLGVAVAPLLVQDAHFARPEAFVTALTVLAVALCWPDPRPSEGRWLTAAGVLGVLVACKVSMLALAWLPLVPWWLHGRKRPGAWRLPVLLPWALALGFAVGAPGALAHPGAWWHGVKYLMDQYAGLHPPHSHLDGGPVADLLGAYFVTTLGWPTIAALGIGVGVLAGRRRWGELVLLVGPVLLFAGYFATRGVFFERNLSHVVPLALVVAAYGVAAVAEWLGRRWPGAASWSAGGLAIATSAPILVTITWPLVTIEFSGEGARRFAEFQERLRAAHPSAEWREVQLLNDGPLAELAETVGTGRRSVLLRVADYRDEWTAFNVRQLEARFVARLVADHVGTFPQVPMCTLLTYHSPRHRYYLVTALAPVK